MVRLSCYAIADQDPHWQHVNSKGRQMPATYLELGGFGRETTTDSTDAQLWFDRGLIWAYGFNHEEAEVCFEKAVEHDPDFALGHWGIAFALGPNYNKAWEDFAETDLRRSCAKASEAASRAMELHESASPPEQGLIKAIARRHPSAEPPIDGMSWNQDYADAMREVYELFPSDLDVSLLFADSLMNLTPWSLWDLTTGEPAAGASTLEIKEILEAALSAQDGFDHPGLLHMYVHLMEMSSTPELALDAANRLRELVPDAGHLVHMPTHIDVLCGHYENAVTTNASAIAADKRFVETCGEQTFYNLYRAHNYHFKLYAAMFLGQRATAIETADELATILPERLLRVEDPPMADWLEGFVPMKMHALIRFGLWEEIIDAPLPEDGDLYCATTATMHYAKGVALAATGAVDRAREEEALFTAAVERVPESRTLFNNTCRDILAIAAEMLKGEIEYRAGNYPAAFAHLRRSIELDDSLPYDEPWGWMQPTRHAYGALLLEQGHVEEAASVYRADLGLDDSLGRAFQHKDNIWSLHGYHECLLELGREQEAAEIKGRLDLAMSKADIPIASSCFCRLSATSDDGDHACDSGEGCSAS